MIACRNFQHVVLAGLSLALAILLPACSKPPAANLTRVAQLDPPAIDELSGLAASRRTENLLWGHNDSDGEPVLYGLGIDGKLRGTIRVDGVKNIDWEDIASFELEGRAWLMVADIGENIRRTLGAALYVVPEPSAAELSPDRETIVRVAWTIPVRYPDGPHDCESVAVDVREGNVYLLRKRTYPNPLFVLPLHPVDPQHVPLAREVLLMKHLPQPTSEQRAFPVATGRYRGSPTAMDISADGLHAAVLTYGDVLLFQRRPGEAWARAFSRRPVLLPPHGLEQAEALCFSADGRSLFVSEEKLHAALLRYDPVSSSAP